MLKRKSVTGALVAVGVFSVVLLCVHYKDAPVFAASRSLSVYHAAGKTEQLAITNHQAHLRTDKRAFTGRGMTIELCVLQVCSGCSIGHGGDDDDDLVFLVEEEELLHQYYH